MTCAEITYRQCSWILATIFIPYAHSASMGC